MKRTSDVVYLSRSQHVDRSHQTEFKFDNNSLPKIVDYSFHEDSDDDSQTACANPVEELRVQLDALVRPVPARLRTVTDAPTRRKVSSARNLTERASLKLKAEEDEEKIRKERLMAHLNNALSASRSVCDSDRPEKKRKVDMSTVLEKLMARKCRLLRDRISFMTSRKSEPVLKKNFLNGLLRKYKE